MKEIKRNYSKGKKAFDALKLLLILIGSFIQIKSFGQTTQTFTSSGTFTVPAGVTSVQVEAWGGGGGGGGVNGSSSQTRAGGGGAGGAYVKNNSLVVTPGANISVTVGSGGDGNDSDDGDNGGQSKFGSLVTANGGTGGKAGESGNQYGAGGGVTTGTFNGGSGSAASSASSGSSGAGGGGAGSTGAGGNATGVTAGIGGAGGGGAGGAGRTTSGDGNDAAGLSGGGGGGRSSSSSDRSGGDGFRGQVKVTYTCPAYLLTTTSGASPICASNSTSVISLTASAAALPVGSYTVTYNRSSPSATGLTTTMTVSAAGSGSFTATGLSTAGNSTITITSLASAGCSSSISNNNTSVIAVNASPAANASSNGPVCSGHQLDLLSSSTGVTYLWSGPASFSSTSQNPSRPNALTTYSGTYTLTVTSTTTGCTASTTTSATVNSTPVATASNSGSCAGSTLNLTGGPGSQSSYSWVGPNGYTSSSQSPSRSNAQISYSGTYTLTVTSSAGCSSSASTTATVNPVPSASANNNGPVCQGSNLGLSASGGSSYSWSGPNSYSSSSQNPNISNIDGGDIGTYTVTVTASGCTATASTVLSSIKAHPLPAPAISATNVCSGNPVTLTSKQDVSIGNSNSFGVPSNNSTGITSQIAITAFSPSSLASATIKSVSFNIDHNNVGDLEISLVSPSGSSILLVNNRGGSGNDFVNTTIVNSGGANGNVASAGAPFTGTYNTETAFTTLNGANTNGTWGLKVVDNVNNNSGTLLNWTMTLVSSGVTYSWSSNPSGFSSSLQNPIANPLQNTTYTVIADASGCTNSGSVSVTSLALPEPFASTNAPICQGNGLMLFGNNNASGQSTGNAWSWTGPSFSSALQNPAIGSVSLAAAGTYTLTITNSLGCTASASSSVAVNTNPVLSIGTQTNVSCNGLSDGQVDIEAGNGTPLYLFDMNGNSTLDGIYTGLAAGNYTASVIDDNGCESVPFIVNITEPAVVAAAAASNTPVCLTTTLNLTGNSSGGTAPYTYSWTGPDNFSSTDQNPFVSALLQIGAGQYLMQVTDAHGCTATTSTAVAVAQPPVASASLNSNADICLGQPISVQLGFTGTAPWNYVVSDGVQAVSGSTSSNPVIISIIPSTAGTHNYSVVSVTDAYCNVGGTAIGSAIAAVSSTAPSNNVGTLLAPVSACNGEVVSISSNMVGGQNIRYSWNTGSNSSVVKFSTSSSGPFVNGPFETTVENVYVQFGALVGSSGYNVCVKGVNGCGNTNNKCIWIRGKVSVPGTINGSVVACSGDTKNYSAGTSGGASVYNWTFSVPGAVINNNGTQNVTVTFPSFTTGQLCVTAALLCGGSSISAPRCATISNAPALPGIMNGPNKICPGATNVSYSVPVVAGAEGYNWTVPPGATIVEAMPYTNSIHVNFPSSYNNSPPVCVTAFSTCGSSTARCRNVSSAIPLTPQPITGPSAGICNSTIQYSIANVAGATGYTWLVPTGATNLIGQGTTSIQFDMPAPFTNGFVRVAANNNSCATGSSSYRSLAVSGAPTIPTAIISLGQICDYQFASVYVDPVISATSYNWVLTNGSIDYGQGTNNIDLTWGSGAGTIKVRAANACGLSPLQLLDVTPSCRIIENYFESKKIQNEIKTNVYPNPAHDKIVLDFNSAENENAVIQITDFSGRTIKIINYSTEKGLNHVELELNNFAKGAYIIQIKSDKINEQLPIVVQ